MRRGTLALPWLAHTVHTCGSTTPAAPRAPLHVGPLPLRPQAGRRRGIKEDVLRQGLQQLDALLPNVLSLHRMKPSDWVGGGLGRVGESLQTCRGHHCLTSGQATPAGLPRGVATGRAGQITRMQAG